jgi:hypothetical protein
MVVSFPPGTSISATWPQLPRRQTHEATLAHCRSGGWFVDDVSITATGCLAPTNYCTATANSSGSPGEIAAIGSTSISANDLSLRARLCPANQLGIFYYGTSQIYVFLGDGYRCVGGSTFRLNPPAQISGAGRASRGLDFSVPPLGSGAGQVLPGSTWSFQFWFRDPMGIGGGFNYTDALEMMFCP